MSMLYPIDAHLIDKETLFIEWSDGMRRQYALDALRAACPCAECVDEWTGEVRVQRDMFPNMELRSLDEVGRYAFKIEFSDGHALGIFTFRKLRELGHASDVTRES